ncbi:MAG: putative Ig domain-containing protein, partial [Burkholderiaceae bacterium]
MQKQTDVPRQGAVGYASRLIRCVRASVLLFMAALAASFSVSATQTVNGITIDEDLPQARRGVAYSHTIPISGGIGPYTVTILNGPTLPLRLIISPSGVVSGVISCNESNGNKGQDIRVTDSSSPTPIVADFLGNKGLKIQVTAGPAGTCTALTIAPVSVPNPTVGTPYNQTITASGGLGPYTYSVSAGALPAGLTLNASTGVISGTPTTAGAFSFTIAAIDAADSTGSRAYSGTTSASAITVNPATLPNGTVSTAYSQTVSATGGTGPYTFSVSAGSLPAGLSLNAATGAITGTPTTAATSNFTITATDSLGASNARAYSVTINPAITVNPATLPNGTVGVAYSQTVSATGGNGSYTFSVSVGSLPAGLSLNAGTGAITGTPTTAATSNFTITATDGLAATGSRAYAVTINAAITVNPATLPNGAVGTAYSQTVSATGGTGSYTFSLSAGSLPAGLSLNAATGAITGTPTTAATSNFTITATDGLGATGARAYSTTINAAVAVNPATLPNGTVGIAYSQTVSATGGTGSYTFSVSAGSLPAGLSLNAGSGAITGTPTTAATSNFTITATDGLGATGSQAYAVTINAAITVNPATLPNGTVGTAYSQTVSATGGTGSYTFSVSVGSLPAGLSLNAATGAITGTPTTAATSNFTITATDGLGATGSRAYAVTINAAITVNPATLPNGTVGTAY